MLNYTNIYDDKQLIFVKLALEINYEAPKDLWDCFSVLYTHKSLIDKEAYIVTNSLSDLSRWIETEEEKMILFSSEFNLENKIPSEIHPKIEIKYGVYIDFNNVGTTTLSHFKSDNTTKAVKTAYSNLYIDMIEKEDKMGNKFNPRYISDSMINMIKNIEEEVKLIQEIGSKEVKIILFQTIDDIDIE